MIGMIRRMHAQSLYGIQHPILIWYQSSQCFDPCINGGKRARVLETNHHFNTKFIIPAYVQIFFQEFEF
jgi:hypothetical protein